MDDEGDNPIALLDLAQYIRSIGNKVDCYYIEDIQKKDYDLIGLSILTRDDYSINDALYLKKKFKDKKIVLGGKGVSSLNDYEIELLKKKGIIVWDGSGEKFFSEKKDIDFKNYPSWNNKDFQTLKVHNNAIMSSRGCPFNCNFCHNTEKRISFFNPKRAVDNIELLFKLGKEYVFFVDDVFTINTEHMINIYNECKIRGINIEGNNKFFTHINLINDKTSEAMSRFKPKIVQVGLESGDNRMLKRMGKTFTVETAYEKVKSLSKYVPLKGLFLIGFTGETKESLDNTLKFAEKLKPFLKSVWVSLYQPVPNTVGYELAKKEGKIINLDNNNNREISYIDYNLNENILKKYRDEIFNIFRR